MRASAPSQGFPMSEPQNDILVHADAGEAAEITWRAAGIGVG